MTVGFAVVAVVETGLAWVDFGVVVLEVVFEGALVVCTVAVSLMVV